MAGEIVKVTDFRWTATYFQEIYDALILWKRNNCPELTDESEHDPAMQLLAAFALVGHMNNTRIDMAAVESMLRTAKLSSSVRELLRLIGYEMRGAVPAKAEVLYTLVSPLTGPTTIVPEGARCATTETSDSLAVDFEADEEIAGDQTEDFDFVFANEGGTFTDYTANTNNLAPDFDPWATPAVGDEIYFGSETCMWNHMNVRVAAAGSDIEGVWEVYDGEYAKAQPDAVAINGGQLEFDVNDYLGLTNRTGTILRVQLNSSREYEDVEVFWTGVTNKVLTSYLGQVAPSTDATKYTIGSAWEEIDGITAATALLNGGEMAFDLPQTVSRRWKKIDVNNQTAYWLRFRIVAVGGAPTSPTIDQVIMTGGLQYVLGTVTQGLSQVDNPLGSGTGEPDQRFELSRDFFLSGTEEFAVNGIVWTRVTNFVNSGPLDEHYMVQLGDNDRATIVCGPTGHGKAPPAGVNNVSAAYRYGADVDGNVGAGTITVDRAGLTLIQTITNPRKAVGWSEAQGASEESLERAKQLGPATLRTPGEVAISPDDVVSLALNMQDENGASPFSRAWAVEELFGPKTIGLIVVGSGGGSIPEATLTETDTYFNGDKFAVPPKPKRVVANNEVTTVNYTAKAINVHAQLTASVSGALEQEDIDSIEASLTALLDPEAVIDTGYAWQFGDVISQSRILHEIHRIGGTKIAKVVLVGWVDVTLSQSELPVAGTILIEAV